jgi:hypothetical protein
MMLRMPFRPFHKIPIAAPLVPLDAPSIRYRPVVPLRVFSPTSGATIFLGDAFLDSGSDLTVIHSGFAAALQITTFVHQLNHRWKGSNHPVRFATVRLELSDRTSKVEWPATVGFTDAPITYNCLLGLSGFCEFFDVRLLGS